MLKPILTFSAVLFLSACALAPVKQIPAEVRGHQRVNFFAGGQTVAAFKAVGRMNDFELEGVLRIQKIGEEDFDIKVLSGGSYRVLHANVTPQGIAYLYLFPEADTGLARGRINQLLNLLVSDPGAYQNVRLKGKELTVTYEGKDAKTRLLYQTDQVYPYAAKTITLLNTADLFYSQYAPANAQGDVQVPHELIYKDGNIELELALISLK